MTFRAIWRVKRQDLPLAYDLMASKPLQLDEVVSKVKGVMLFSSAVGGVTTNSMNKKLTRRKILVKNKIQIARRKK